MSDTPCTRQDAHEPHSWGNLDWCPGGERQEPTPILDAIRLAYCVHRSPCLPTLGESCGVCHRCRDTSCSESRHCDGCGEDYDPFEESHVGHEGQHDVDHWLLFEGWRIVGCHCGFQADVDADCGRGDSVVVHLLTVGGVQ